MNKSVNPRNQWLRRETAAVVGPIQSAIRAKCSLGAGETLAGFEPVFARIGSQLDRIIASADHEAVLVTPVCIIVAVSDVAWGDRVLATHFAPEEFAMPRLKAAFEPLEKANLLPETVCSLWTTWSRQAHRNFRRRLTAWDDRATAAVGGILFSNPGALGEIAAIGGSGRTPILAIALNSKGSTQERSKCSVRAAVIPLPDWARARGAVAGNA